MLVFYDVGIALGTDLLLLQWCLSYSCEIGDKSITCRGKDDLDRLST